MSRSEYDASIERLFKATTPSPYDAAIDRMAAPRIPPLRDSANQAVKVAPDRAAEVDTLTRATGLPSALVERNFDVIKKKAETEATPYGAILQQSPKLAEWLKTAQNAAMTQDELPHMGFLDSVLTTMGDLARSPISGALQGLGSSMQGIGQFSDSVDRRIMDYFDTAHALDRFKEGYGKERQGFTRLPPFPGVFPDDRRVLPSQTAPPAPWWAVSSVLQVSGKKVNQAGKFVQIPQQRRGFVSDVMEGLGQLVPQIASALLAPEAATAMLLGQGANNMADTVQGDNVAQYKKDIAILTGAGITLGTEKFGLEMLLKRVPAPVRNAIVTKIADVAAAAGIEAAQEVTEQVLDDVTRRVLTDPKAPIGQNLGAIAGTSGAVGGLARLVLTSVLGMHAESHFKERQDGLSETTKAVTGSKLFERAPDALRDFIAQHAKGSPSENVLIPVEPFQEYFQSKGLDPAQAANDLMPGGAEAYRDAVTTGGELQVPFADYETKLAPEHGKFFDQEVRFHPTEMNAREAEAWIAREGGRMTEEQKAASPDAGIEASGEKIKQDILGQITGEFDPVAAESNATAVAEIFKTLGQRFGFDPFEKYSEYNLKIKFPLPDILKSKTAVDSFDAMIERVRAGDVPKPGDIFGKSLVEWLRAEGGVQDVGGDLASREPDKGLKPFTRNLIQEQGMSLDTAVLRAREEGYIPESADINALIDTIDNELRGESVYSQHALDTPEAQRMDALFQLDSFVRQRGMDLKSMSNEQVKKVLEEASRMEQSGNGLEFLQGDEKNRRGSLVFNVDGSFNINLFTKRNLSTFIHETGHFYLEVFGDLVDELRTKDPSTLTSTQQVMLADYDKALKHLGVENRAAIGEEQHELWARTLEAYVREGKAPSIELRNIFARFRSWLLELYRNVRSLNVTMNPEIREVMDRLFATDQAIEQAANEAEIKSLFMTQEESGLDNEGWAAYQTKLQRASDEAKSTLQSKLMKEFAREREQWWKNESEKLHDEIAAQVYRQPEYIALAALKKGEYPDGTESPIKTKLDLNAIKERFGKNTTITDQIRKLGVARLEDGLDPDVAARQFGYSSGEELVAALVNARPMNELIDAETRDEMIRRHGDMRLDGSIHDEAQQAVLGQYRDEVVREEMRALRRLQQAGRPAQEAEARRQMAEREYERRWFEAEARMNIAIAEGKKQSEIDSLRAEMAQIKTEQKQAAQAFVGNLRRGEGIPTPEQVTRFAEDRLRATIIGDVMPSRYWAAARKASREATAAAGKQDYAVALLAKGRELLNLELYRQANDLKDSFEKTRSSWLKMFRPDSKIATKRTMEYVTAARAIASKLLFPDKQTRVLESMEALKKYDPDAYEDVQDAISSIVEDPRKLKELTVEEFNGVRDIVESLWTRARQDNLVTVDGKKIERQKVQDELAANISQYSTKAGRIGKNATITDIEKAGVNGLSLLASLRRVEAWAEGMDGKSEGPWRTYVWNPVKEAIDAYRVHKVEVLGQYAELLKPIEPTLTKDWIHSPELNYTFRGGKAELLGAMLHSGNRESPMSNLSKLLRGRRDVNNIPWGHIREDSTLDTSKWDEMVRRMQRDGILTKQDYDFMQGVWHLFGSLKPGLQQSHHETKGFYFKEVPADPFETPWGTYPGGYVPAKADPFMSTAAAIRSDKQSMSEAGNSYALPSAGLGNTKTRLAVAEPLSMNLQFIPGHIDWALRLTHIEPRVKDVSKMIFDRSFRATIDAHNPAVVKDMLVPWLQRAATQRLEEMGKYKALDSFARLLRTGSGIQAVSFSVNNGLQQATGVFLAATKVPPGKLLGALGGYIAGPTRFTERILAKSDFMKTFAINRAIDIQQDINDIVLDPNVYAKAQNFTRKHGQVMAGMTQNVVNLIAWQGAYDAAAAEGKTEKQAVRFADSTIRLTQGSFFAEDISRAETGTPFVRALTMFSSYFNMQANLLVTEGSKAIYSDSGAMVKAGRLLSVYALGFMIPSVLAQAIQNALTGRWKEEDDSYMMGALKLFFGSQLRAGAMFVPGAGGVLQAGVNSVLTSSSFDDDIRTTPWLQMHGKAIKDFGVWWNEGDDATEIQRETARKNLAKDALNILGIYARLPLGPLGKPLGFLMDLDAGKVQPKGAGDVVRGLVTGSIPKE